MNKSEYLKTLKNCDTWFDYARNQKMVADKILYNCAMEKEFFLQLKERKNRIEFNTLICNAHYHYGIAIENGLKGLVIKYQPDSVCFVIKGENVVLKNIGGKAGKSHDLLTLAEFAGLFNHTELFNYESDYKASRCVLLHLSEMIKWAARYPIPNNMESVYKFDNSVPYVQVYGFHILDVMAPIFELFEKERI